MMTTNAEEIDKFDQLSADWWDTLGPLKTLHHINPTRLAYINSFVDVDQLSCLDVGCGGGILSEGLASSGALVTGIDLSGSLIEVARAHAKENELDITYSQNSIEEIANSDAKFDMVVCFELLEHVDDPALFLKHCVDALKEGGHLFISTINRTLIAYLSLIVGAEYCLRWLPVGTHDYMKFLKPSEIVSIFRSLAVEVVSMKGLSYHPVTKKSSLTNSMNVNYFIYAKKYTSTI